MSHDDEKPTGNTVPQEHPVSVSPVFSRQFPPEILKIIVSFAACNECPKRLSAYGFFEQNPLGAAFRLRLVCKTFCWWSTSVILETVVVGANFWNNLYGLEQLEFAAEVLTSEPQHRDLIRVLRFEDRHGHTLLWGHPAYPRTRLLLLGQPPNLRKVVSWVRHDYRMAGPLRTEELEIGSSRILDPPLYPHQLVFAGPERWTGLKRVKASLRPTIESLSFFTNVWGPHLSILSHLCLDLLSAELSVKECDALQQQKDKLDQFVELLSRATSETGLLVFVVYGTDYRYEAHHRHPWRSKATSQRLMQLLESETTWVCSLHACFRETFSRHDFGEGKVLHYHDMEEYLSSADGRKWRASLGSHWPPAESDDPP